MKVQDYQLFKYSFKELQISKREIGNITGFKNEQIPEPFNQYIDDILNKASANENIQGAFRIYSEINIDKDFIWVNDIKLNTGKIIARELRNASSLAVFICTAGFELEHFSKKLMSSGCYPEAYIADTLGSVIVEKAMDKIQVELKNQAANQSGYKITNRYSPGYCGWNVTGQQALFSLISGDICGIKLLESSLMQPIKSISGIIGIGAGVFQREYTCSICEMENCIYSKLKQE